MPLFVTVVLDGVGIGAQPDADRYGDTGSHTLAHVCEVALPRLPNLAQFGLGTITPLQGVPVADQPRAHYGRMTEVSAGKDSTTGHWELAGLRLDEPFPTYPDGFPDDVIDTFIRETGCKDVLGNRTASGTAIIAELGTEHEATGYPIVYTSSDSVFQIAAHKEVIPLDDLYDLCKIAREKVCVDEHAVGRVIARPFVGSDGDYERISGERKDYSRLPHRPPVQDELRRQGVRTVAIGKIGDLFGNVGFDQIIKTTSNAEGIDAVQEQMQHYSSSPEPTFLWANLVDFDQEYGHRNDPKGFARALEQFDKALPGLADRLPDDGCLTITADHGNDPTTESTDHSREYVPLLVYTRDTEQHGGRDLGLRASFNDHAATVAHYLGADFETEGTPFL